DEPRIQRAERLVVDAEARRRPGARALEHHVRLARQAVEDGAPLGRLQVERQAPLVPPESGMPMPIGSVGEQTASTSIPRSASSMEQNGPGSWRDRSSIRNRERAPGMIRVEYYDRATRDNLDRKGVVTQLDGGPESRSAPTPAAVRSLSPSES